MIEFRVVNLVGSVLLPYRIGLASIPSDASFPAFGGQYVRTEMGLSNQVSFKHSAKGRPSLRAFGNGRIQFLGARSRKDAADAIKALVAAVATWSSATATFDLKTFDDATLDDATLDVATFDDSTIIFTHAIAVANVMTYDAPWEWDSIRAAITRTQPNPNAQIPHDSRCALSWCSGRATAQVYHTGSVLLHGPDVVTLATLLRQLLVVVLGASAALRDAWRKTLQRAQGHEILGAFLVSRRHGVPDHIVAQSIIARHMRAPDSPDVLAGIAVDVLQ